MSSSGKCHQILFFFVTLFICDNTGVSCQITIAVLFNSTKPQNPSTATSSMAIKKSFEKIPSMLDIDENINFVYKDLNSTFCDLGTFLEFMDGILAYEVVVLLLEDCECEEKLLFFLDILSIKSVSSCERPLFTANGTSAVIQKVHKERQLYLLVSADAYGVEFYQDLSFELQRQKLKVHRTLWVGVESGRENQLENELERVARNMDDNITPGVTFVSGFLYTNDFRLKSLINLARRILGEQFCKILWIFPVIHLDFSNMQTFRESSQVLAFRESNSVHCNHNQMCALRHVLRKTSHVLKSCWEKDRFHRDNLTEYSRSTTAMFEYSVQKVERGRRFSVKNQECQISLHNCFTDVVQLTTDHYIGETTWKRIATWNGETIQPCSSHGGSANVTLNLNIHTVFRVPIVEYSPYIVKHELSHFNAKCPISSLPCYGQLRKTDDTTVINYADKYCCSGWTVDILIYLTAKLSYEFELYFQAEKLFGVYDNMTGQWNGMIQDIISGKGDISVDLGIVPDRCGVLDCSVGYLFDGINVIIKLEFSETDSPDKDYFHALVGNFQIFLNPFHVDLLVVVLMIFNVFLFLIWATDKICLSYRNKRFGRKREKFTLLESTSYVWATAFGRDVGDSKKPLTLSARYLSSWLAFLSLIFVNVYVARLMAEIVKQEPTKPFTSLQDPEILNKKLKLGVVKATSMEAFFHNTRNPVLKQTFENTIKENLLPSLDEGVKAVKNGTLDGFIADTVSLVTILNEDPNCSLALLGRDVSVNAVGFMFRKDWPWAEEFKLQELAMNENKRNEDWWKMKQSYPLCKRPSHEHPQLTAADMSGVFLVLIFAIAYCCFSLIMENIHSLLVYRYRNSSGDWNVPHNHRTNVTASNLSLVGE